MLRPKGEAVTSEPRTCGPVDLLFAGSVFCDLVFAGVPTPEPGAEVYAEAFAFTPGGVATRAVAGARTGARTVLLSQLGDDPLGRHVAGVLAREPNLDLSWLEHRAGFQSPVTVSLTGEHEREFITYQEPAEPLEWPPGRPTVGATHVSLQRDLPEWVARLRDAGTLVYGGVGWDSSGEWSHRVIDRLAAVDVFVPNDSEAMRYTNTDTPTAAARELGRHVALAVVTCGARGVVAYERASDRLVQVPAVPVTATDPTGAGDVFVATFMATGRFGWTLEQRLRLAGLAASLSVRTLGGAVSAPHPHDVSRYLGASGTPDLGDPAQDWSAIQDWARTQPRHQPTTATSTTSRTRDNENTEEQR